MSAKIEYCKNCIECVESKYPGKGFCVFFEGDEEVAVYFDLKTALACPAYDPEEDNQ